MADDAKKDTPIFASVTPPMRLENDALPENPRRVIRTLASDIARVTGAPAPQPATPARPEIKPQPVAAKLAPHQTLGEAISAIKLESDQTPRLPPLSKRREDMYVRKPESKAAEVPSSWSRAAPAVTQRAAPARSAPSFFETFIRFLFGNPSETRLTTVTAPELPSYSPRNADAPAPPPIPVTAPKSPPPMPEASPAPAFEPQYPVVPTTQEAEAGERAAVLARLRARIAEHRTETPAPVFPIPKPEETAKPERLHTMSSDFSTQIDRKSASAFSVLAAQADAVPAHSAGGKARRGLAYALIATVLVVGGSLIVYYAYANFSAHQPIPVIVETAPATLIRGDDSESFSGNGAALVSSLADAANAPVPLGTVRIAYHAIATSTFEKSGAMVAAMNLPAPDILLRNLGDESTVGIVHAGSETRPFFVLAANSYERTFAGMLAWEPTMASDLAVLYPAYPMPVPDVATTSTVSTQPSSTTTAGTVGFVDEVVTNHDVRAYKDENGKTILLYGYRDQNTLIIARDETAFTLLLARISAN